MSANGDPDPEFLSANSTTTLPTRQPYQDQETTDWMITVALLGSLVVITAVAVACRKLYVMAVQRRHAARVHPSAAARVPLLEDERTASFRAESGTSM